MARTAMTVLRLVAYRAERAMAVADEMRAFAILPEGLPKIDTGRANVARAWNYMAGGKDNFEVDREAARQLMEVAPVIRIAAPASRAFLRRAVRYLADDAGIRQFVDIGTGLPTAGNTHEVAQGVAPECRVVYVITTRSCWCARARCSPPIRWVSPATSTRTPGIRTRSSARRGRR